MIYQEAPRRSLRGCVIDERDGFWVEGKDLQDCVQQLREWGSQHPEKWIFVYDCGLGPGYPVPVARHLLEVSVMDSEPSLAMWFWTLFQEGRK